MNFIDSKYVSLISSRFDKFSKKKDNLYNLRCPYCGDSQKHKNKARGYFYEKKGDYVFKCHNCGVGRTLSNFLKDHAPDLHQEYILDSYKETSTGKGTYRPDPKFEFEKPKFSYNPDGLISINNLNTSHPAKLYVEKRQIPKQKLNKLFYVEQYKTWVNTQKHTFDVVTKDHERIIIPLIYNDTWFGFQGRALDPKNPLRYITTILDESNPKIFGLDTIDWSKPIYITEGPFDSMFLDNSIAMVGADVDWSFLETKAQSKFIFVYDNEPRNPQITARMQKVIDKKFPIVIFDSDIPQKDINDMVLGGRDVQRMVETNTYYGLESQLKFNNWKKV